MKLPDILTADEELERKASTYSGLLLTPSHGRQPDPFCELPEGWYSEQKGKYMWPPTMYCDICKYFVSLNGDINRSLTNKALNAYKEGKAYSYFDSGWLREIFYHPVTDSNTYCFVKAQCSPSQKIGDVPHNVWVMLKKKCGEIQSAYCTCFAGLGSTCNHIAAVLFKMDFFWRQGLTNKSCTDKECEWNKGVSKVATEPKTVQDLDFRKPQFGKQHIGKQRVILKNDIKPFSLRELSDALIDSCPDAVVFKSQKSVSPDDVFTVEVSSVCKPLSELFLTCSKREDILAVLQNFSHDDVTYIEESTRGQAGNVLWKSHRINRITASIVHNVHTKMETLKDTSSKRSKDPNPILNTITKHNTTDFMKVPQLKYGIEMEKEARNKYRNVMANKHKCLAVREVGLVVSLQNSQYGASPDGVVTCSCCGTGLLEIKCLLSIAHTSPSAENLPYLQNVGSLLLLSKSSQYFSQIQWQMGICQKKWCDFFVYTRQGYHLETVCFNIEHFNLLSSNADVFYHKVVIPAVLAQNSNMPLSCVNKTNYTQLAAASPLPTSGGSSDINADNCFILSKHQNCPKPTKRRKTGKMSSVPVYLCGVCHKVCQESDSIDDEDHQSVQCSHCFEWYHFVCVAYTATLDEFICQSCNNF